MIKTNCARLIIGSLLMTIWCVHLRGQSDEVIIPHHITNWVFDSTNSFYGYSSIRCTGSEVFSYDKNMKLKWTFEDTGTSRLIYEYIYLNPIKNEIVLAGYEIIAEDVAGVQSFILHRLGEDGKLLSAIKWLPPRRRLFFPGDFGFAISSDTSFIFGFQTETLAAYKLFTLNNSLKIIDIVLLDKPYSRLLYSESFGILLEKQDSWWSLRDTSLPAFSGFQYARMVFKPLDSLVWYYTFNRVFRQNKNTGEIKEYDLSIFFFRLNKIEVDDSQIYVLGSSHVNDQAQFSVYSIYPQLELKSKIDFKYELPYLIHQQQGHTTIFAYRRLSPKRFLSRHPTNEYKPPTTIDLRLESANFKILNTYPVIFNGQHIGTRQSINFCALIHNLSNRAVELQDITSNYSQGFNCGGFTLKLNRPVLIQPLDSIWVCDTVEISFGEVINRRLCFYIGWIKGAVDSNTLNDEICIFTSASKSTSEDKEKVDIFPNPSDQWIHINSSAAIHKFKIIDMMGSAVLDGVFMKDYPIDVSSLPIGHYFIALYDREKSWVRKIVILR